MSNLNAELLLEKVCDSKFLRLILESDEKWKEEIKDEEVRREGEKVRKRVKVLERKLSNSARAFCWRLL